MGVGLVDSTECGAGLSVLDRPAEGSISPGVLSTWGASAGVLLDGVSTPNFPESEVLMDSFSGISTDGIAQEQVARMVIKKKNPENHLFIY